VKDARSGKSVALLEDFDSATQQRLRDRAQAASKATGDLLPADPAYQLLQGPPPSTPKDVKVLEQKDDRATLAVETGQGPAEKVVMVHENGRWRVELP
jgi:hypothetical protein